MERNPFAPLIISEGELLERARAIKEKPRISDFYRPGWRQDAYRIFEENKEAAHEIVRIIEPHLGLHEIVHCEIWGLESLDKIDPPRPSGFLGYDVAYPGGDFYSAVLNGLLVN